MPSNAQVKAAMAILMADAGKSRNHSKGKANSKLTEDSSEGTSKAKPETVAIRKELMDAGMHEAQEGFSRLSLPNRTKLVNSDAEIIKQAEAAYLKTYKMFLAAAKEKNKDDKKCEDHAAKMTRLTHKVISEALSRRLELIIANKGIMSKVTKSLCEEEECLL